MKKKKFNVKLKLNKSTIAKLNNTQVNVQGFNMSGGTCQKESCHPCTCS